MKSVKDAIFSGWQREEGRRALSFHLAKKEINISSASPSLLLLLLLLLLILLLYFFSFLFVSFPSPLACSAILPLCQWGAAIKDNGGRSLKFATTATANSNHSSSNNNRMLRQRGAADESGREENTNEMEMKWKCSGPPRVPLKVQQHRQHISTIHDFYCAKVIFFHWRPFINLNEFYDTHRFNEIVWYSSFCFSNWFELFIFVMKNYSKSAIAQRNFRVLNELKKVPQKKFDRPTFRASTAEWKQQNPRTISNINFGTKSTK